MRAVFFNLFPVLLFVLAMAVMVARSRGIVNGAMVFRLLLMFAFLVVMIIRVVLRGHGH